MRKKLKAVALIIIGIALTGGALTLAIDSNADVKKPKDTTAVESKAADSTVKAAKTTKKTAKKDEGKTEKNKPTTATDANASDTVTTETGLQYVITRKGKGDVAKSGQDVAVHYAGRLAANDKEFDNSFKRQSPIEFKLGIGRVIKGWDEGIAGMQVGEQRTLIIPSELAYGKRDVGNGLIPPNSILIFDVELVAIKSAK